MAAAKEAILEESLFSLGWTAREEVKLLGSIEEYGYGNWYRL